MNKTVFERSVEFHKEAKGKIGIRVTVPLETQEDLSLAYTPGVARTSEIIAENPEAVYDFTWKGNSVLVVTDGSAVLGLGNVGPKAATTVMEGKAALFSKYAGINAVPMCLDTQDTEEIIKAVKWMAPAYGGINLEDISAPRCVEIERRLIKELDIPVFHDDQHGTAIVVTAALINAVKVVKKEISDLTVVVSGTGAAGSAIIKMLHNLGVKEIYGFNIDGIIRRGYAEADFLIKELGEITNSKNWCWSMEQAMRVADVFIGVSKGNLVTEKMVKSMKRDPIVFAMANPYPEITYEAGKAAGAKVMGTGRSDYPNQINNLLAFPGVFRGALDCRTSIITEEQKLSAAYALAALVSPEELCEDYIIVKPTDERVVPTVANAIMTEARKQGVARK